MRSKGGSTTVFESFSSGVTRPLRWAPDAVRRLCEDVEWALKSNPTGAAEVAGVLLGKNSSGEIVDCQPVLLMQEQDHAYALTGPGRREFERAVTTVRSIPESEFSVAGFYRSQLGNGLDVTEEDLRLVRTCFADSGAVLALMKRAGDGSSSVRLFSGDGGQLLSEFRSTEDGSGLPEWVKLWQSLSEEPPPKNPQREDATEITERTALAQVAEPAPIAQPEQPPTPEPDGAQKNSPAIGRSLARHPAILVALATIFLVVMGLLIFNGPASLKHGISSQGAAAQNGQAGSSQYPALALRVEKQGDDVRLDWDRTAPVLAAATGGMLTIREGNGPEKQVLLDINLLRTGAVMYRPVHGDLFLRLVIFGPNGRNMGEAVARYPQRVSASGSHPFKGE